MYKKLIRYSIIVIAAAGFMILAVSLFNAPKNTHNSGIVKLGFSASLRKNSDTLKIVLIGDSIARGTGDEKGDGVSTYIPEYLKSKTSRKVSVYNAGINELQSEGLINELRSGKLDSPIADSDLVVMSIGGNDILSLQYVTDISKYDAFNNKRDMYSKNLKEALALIRKNSPSTLVAFVGLYNPREDGFSALNNIFLSTWNNSTKKVIEEDGGAVFIPTLDIFKSNLNKYLSADTLHPNSSGYQAISNKIVNSVENILN